MVAWDKFPDDTRLSSDLSEFSSPRYSSNTKGASRTDYWRDTKALGW